MKRVLAIALLAALLPCCTIDRRADSIPFCEISNVCVTPLHEVSGAFLFAMNKDPCDQGRKPVWGVLHDGGFVEILDQAPQVSFFQLREMSISPSDKYLAVISTGEGHPCLDVFRLKTVLYPPESLRDEQGLVDPIAFIDPYPGTVTIKGWQGDCLLIESEAPLDKLDKNTRTLPKTIRNDEFADPPYTVYRWDISSDQITKQVR